MPMYPTIPSAFPTRQDGDLIFAEHMNTVQGELTQITTGLLTGLMHHLYPGVDLAYSLGIQTKRWKELWAGAITADSVTVTNLIVSGSVTLPPLPPQPPLLHAPTHAAGGTDPVAVTALAGFPGGTVNFLRADGTFAPPPNPAPPDLSGYVPYVGATQTVNLNTKALVAGIGTFSGQLSSVGTMVSANNPVIQPGEQHYAGVRFIDNNNAAGSKEFRIVVSGTTLYFQTAADGGSYGGVTMLTLTRSGSATFSNDVTLAGKLVSGLGVFPGRTDAPGTTQTGWGLYSHGSYGLYVNTGLYVANYLWTGAGVSCATAMAVGTTLTVTGATNLNSTTVVLGGHFHTGYYIYPGAITNPNVAQSSWYLASHSSYGLYSNTGLYLGGGIYPAGGMDPGYLLRETSPTDFVPDGLGSYTINTNHGSIFMRHNGWLFVSWALEVSFPGAYTYGHFYLPGGFTAQRFHNAPVIVLAASQYHSARAEIAAGSALIYIHSPSGNFGGIGRMSGQLMVYVG